MLELQPVLAWLPEWSAVASLRSPTIQHALVALLLMAPTAASMGVQVVTFRMAFFSDAISHSAFAGVALGLLLSIDPRVSTPAFGLLVAVAIVAYIRRSELPSDTITGVVFAAVVAAGLAAISRERDVARTVQTYVYGDVLTVAPGDLWLLLALFLLVAAFQVIAYNHTMVMGVSPVVAEVHGVRVARLQYLFAVLLALVVMFAVKTVGVFLVTAMLIVPATAARNLARTAGSMFWWAQAIAITSACAGLLISLDEKINTATGATVVLVAFLWFLVSALVAYRRAPRRP